MAFRNQEIFDYCKKNQIDQEEISSVRIKVVIRLSDAQYIPIVEKSLYKDLNDPEFRKKGNEITVSAYPPRNNFGENDILAIVQKHDRDARKIQRRS